VHAAKPRWQSGLVRRAHPPACVLCGRSLPPGRYALVADSETGKVWRHRSCPNHKEQLLAARARAETRRLDRELTERLAGP